MPIFKKSKAQINNNTESLVPIIFQNSPIQDDSKDVFDFKNQVKVLHEVSNSDAKIIGIIGDYGSGKSSITELYAKEEKKSKKAKIVRINLWDEFLCSKDEKPVQSVIKSFFYQLAYGNSKKNKNFSEYVNNRFNKKQGKVSFRLATRKSFIVIGFAALLFLLFCSLNYIDFDVLTSSKNLFPKMVQKASVFTVLYFLRYLFLIGAGALIVWAIWMSSPVFSSWKSEGNNSCDNSDISEIYTLIIKRLLPLGTNKVIVFIDDLDRTAKYDTVFCFLKELYRCINLIPEDQAKKILFVVSLRAEETLDGYDSATEKCIYPKIFDYTLHIKPIHNENYYDVVKDLLVQNENKLNANFSHYGKDAITRLLNELRWLYSDENLTIRELKDRLNETFLLYQTLRARDYRNSSVELKKSAAVIFLKRKYPNSYYNIIENEHGLAVLIRECYKITNRETIKNKILNFLSSNKSTKDENSFIDDFTDMLVQNLIEDDFAMYFYSYPKNSYIKTLDEKELFNSITLNDKKILSLENINEKIKTIIVDKKAFAIKEAFSKFPPEKIPDVVYENELLFNYVIEKLEVQRAMIFSELLSGCETLTLKSIDFCHRFAKVLNYSFNKTIYNEFVTKSTTALLNNLKTVSKTSIESVVNIRKMLVTVLKEHIGKFVNIFANDDVPCITKDEYFILADVGKIVEIIEAMSDKKLNEFDELFIDIINDQNVINCLLEHKLYKSVLFSYENNDKLQDFDFTDEKTMNSIINISEELLTENENVFLNIRNAALKQIQDNYENIEYYKLFLDPYPTVSDSEFEIIKLDNLYQVLDYDRIDASTVSLLSDYAKKNINTENDLYSFLQTLFFCDDDNRISDSKVIKELMQNIDFQKVSILKLDEEQINSIIETMSPVYELDNFNGCLDFMRTVQHLVPELEKNVIATAIETDDALLDDYLDLINELNEATDQTCEIIKNNESNKSLESEITNKLYEKQYFLEYIIGKSIKDGELILDDNIPLEQYYYAFRHSPNCALLFENQFDLLNKFVQDELYEDKLTVDRLRYFYSLRQPIKLVRFIMEKLKNNLEELKRYLFSITHFNKEKDALEFIPLITSKDYIDLLSESDLFWHLWHRMWNSVQKGKLTRITNKDIGTNYHSNDKEAERYAKKKEIL